MNIKMMRYSFNGQSHLHSFFCKMLLFFILFSFVFTFSNGIKEIYDYEKNGNGMFKVGIGTNGKFEPYYFQSSKKLKITKSRTCRNNSFPHGMFIEKRSKTPMMLCETNQCKKLKEIQCERNVSTENCNGFFQWISGFESFKNGSSDISKVECCRYKELTFSTFVKFVNFTLTEDYIHEIAVEGGNLKAFEYLTNVKSIKTNDNSTAYNAAVFRMECYSFPSGEAVPLKINEKLKQNLRYQNSSDAKMNAASMRLKIAVMEKHLTGNTSYDIVLPSLEFPNLKEEMISCWNSSTWPKEKKINMIDKVPKFGDSPEEMYKLVIAKNRLLAAEMVEKSPFGYYYKDMTLPIDRDEILKRYRFEKIKTDISEIELKGNELEVKTFVRNPIPYSNGIFETDSGSVKVFERNAAPDAPKDPWLVKHGDDYLSANTIKSFFSPHLVSFYNYEKYWLKDSCGNDSFPHGTYIDWTTNSLMMICERHSCLKPEKIECTIKSEISSCNNSQEWVAGFKTKKTNDTVLGVECCHNKYSHPSKFIKDIIIANGQHFEHNLVINGTKLTAFDFLNNFKMFKTEDQKIVYKASVFRMECQIENDPGNEDLVNDDDYYYWACE